MAVISHANRICFVGPRNGNKHRSKYLLTRQSPVVRHVRENGGYRVIALAKRSVLGWETANHDARFGPIESFLYIAAYFVELLLVDDSADVACLVERIAELERRKLSKMSRWRKSREPAYFVELLLVDDSADVACLVERIAELERFDLLTERIKKIV